MVLEDLADQALLNLILLPTRYDIAPVKPYHE
jgi:hypothetical protein